MTKSEEKEERKKFVVMYVIIDSDKVLKLVFKGKKGLVICFFNLLF